jgi:uncharacterized membrane protein YvbJ
MYCTNCGILIENDVKFCSNCGKAVTANSTPSVQTTARGVAQPVSADNNGQPKTESEKNGGAIKELLKLIFMIVAIIYSIAVIIFSFTGPPS